MNIIWNKDELNKIKTIILNPAKMLINKEDMSLSTKKEVTATSYSGFYEEIERLFYIQDKDDIRNTLLQASQVKGDINNPLHLGLVMSLSKIDVNDNTQIFEILKQLVSQYERVIASVLKKNVNDSTLPIEKRIENVKNKLEEINNNIETEEEKQIKQLMNKIFIYTNNIENNKLFNSIVLKYDVIIKERIKRHLIGYLRTLSNLDERIKESDYREYMREEHYKNLKKRMQKKNANPFIR